MYKPAAPAAVQTIVLGHFRVPNSVLRLYLKNMRLESKIIKGIVGIGMVPFVMQLAGNVDSVYTEAVTDKNCATAHRNGPFDISFLLASMTWGRSPCYIQSGAGGIGIGMDEASGSQQGAAE